MRIEIAGHTYHIEAAGPPSSDTVLMLHGFAQSTDTWSQVAEALACDLRVVLLDLIGHGGSARPRDPEPYRIDDMVAMIDQLRDALGLTRLHLVGYSMGGRIALCHAAQHPERVASVVLESASFGPDSDAERALYAARDTELAARLRASTPEEFAAYWEALPLFARERSLPAHLQSQAHAMRLGNDMESLALTVEGSGQAQMPNLRPFLRHARMPLLYVHGSQDAKYTALARELAHSHGLDVMEFPTGHNVHLEQPEAFARTVRALVDRTYEERPDD